MANRRHIGHNRSFSGNSMPVNPWQGGVPPTVGGISQLTDTQAQLALVLTNLLRPPTLPSQPLPSLLNLPQINPNGSFGDYQRQNYNDRFNNRSNNIRRGRFNDKIQNHSSRDRRREHRRKSEGRNNKARSQSKSNESESKPDSESKIDNQSEELEDKKRDWKEEKKNGIQENGNSDGTKDVEANLETENNDGSKTEDKIKDSSDKEAIDGDASKNSTEEKPRNKDGRYAGIPVKYLKCLICAKSMWDGESFEKHLRGRAHQQMCESLKENYDIQADMMRQAIRFTEERKTIELNRQKRHGKRVEFRKVSHCNMCAFDFYGREAEHRRSAGHQKLKRFLHPRCNRCRIEFPMKIEWEEHRLSPEHIRKIIETKDNTDAVSVADSSEDIFDLNLDGDDYEDEDNDPDNVILDIDENTDLLTNFDNRIPAYKKSRNVGASSITEVTGYFCKLCNRFIQNETKAQAHGKSKGHYDNFIKYLKNKNTQKIKQKETKKHVLDDEVIEEDEDGNWKRRKLSDQPEDGGQPQELKQEDLYDPMEAEEEEEDDDVEIKNEETETVVKKEDETIKIEDVKEEETINIEDVQEEDTEEVVKTEVDVKNEEVGKETATTPQLNARTTRSASGRRPGPLSKTQGRY